MNEDIVVKVKVKHIRNAGFFGDNCNCAVALACKEHFNIEDVVECVGFVGIGGIWYNHDRYTLSLNKEDIAAAGIETDPEKVIREIHLF